MHKHLQERLFHPSSRPAGHGITIGTPRFYDVSVGLLFAGRRRRAYRTLLAAAQVQAGDRVLDVGAGPGYFARILAEATGPEGSVVGIDAAPEMTGYANRKAAHLSNCRFQPGTAESLAFPDAAFDVVVSCLVLHHLPEQARLQAVREMKRVLRPGGKVLLAEFQIPERGLWRRLALLTGHQEMERRVPPLEPLITAAGFQELSSGQAPPWLSYTRATKASLPPNTGSVATASAPPARSPCAT